MDHHHELFPTAFVSLSLHLFLGNRDGPAWLFLYASSSLTLLPLYLHPHIPSALQSYTHKHTDLHPHRAFFSCYFPSRRYIYLSSSHFSLTSWLHIFPFGLFYTSIHTKAVYYLSTILPSLGFFCFSSRLSLHSACCSSDR